MKHFQPFKVFTIIEQVDFDPTFFTCMQHLFEWANKAGLEGKKVGGLILQKNESHDPLNRYQHIWCKIECTEQQEKDYNELMKLNVLPSM